MKHSKLYTFSGRRVACKHCGSSDGFAPILEDNPNSEFGYCHSCKFSKFPYSKNKTRNEYRQAPAPVQAKQHVKQRFISETMLNGLPTVENSNFGKYFGQLFGEGFLEFLHQKGVRSDFKGNTVFPFYGRNGLIWTLKTIPYLDNGHRNKDGLQTIVNGEKRMLPALYGYEKISGVEYLTGKRGFFQCLFNEYDLFSRKTNIYDIDEMPDSKPIILLESEKSCLIAEFHFPDYIWIASGGANGITPGKAAALFGKEVRIIRDNDEAGDVAAEKTCSIIRQAGGFPVIDRVFSELLKDKPKGFDIADLIEQYTINKKEVYNDKQQ